MNSKHRLTQKYKIVLIALPTIISIILIFWNFESLGLCHWDEYNYIVTAKWFLGREDGVFTIYEPPGFPFFMALLFKMFGVRDYVAIATSGVFAVMTVVLVTVVGLRHFGFEVGLGAPILLTISSLFLTYSRMALTDIMFTFFFTAAVISIYGALRSGKVRYIICAGLLLAACSSVKYNGFMPMIIAVCYIPIMLKSVEKDRRVRAALRHFRSILIILAPSLLFAVLFLSLLGVEGTLGDLISMRTVKLLTVGLPDTLIKGLNEFQAAVMAHRGQLRLVPLVEAPFYLQVLASWIPIPILILALIGLLRRDFKENAGLYISIWLLLTFILISSVPARYPRAILPILPPLSLLSAIGMTKLKSLIHSIQEKLLPVKPKLNHNIKKFAGLIVLILVFTLSFPSAIDAITVSHNAYRKAGQILRTESGESIVLADTSLVIAFFYPVIFVREGFEIGNLSNADLLVVDYMVSRYGHQPELQLLEREGRIELVASIYNDMPDVLYLFSGSPKQLPKIKNDWNYTTIRIYRIK